MSATTFNQTTFTLESEMAVFSYAIAGHKGKISRDQNATFTVVPAMNAGIMLSMENTTELSLTLEPGEDNKPVIVIVNSEGWTSSVQGNVYEFTDANDGFDAFVITVTTRPGERGAQEVVIVVVGTTDIG